jgi:hypothetical protein
VASPDGVLVVVRDLAVGGAPWLYIDLLRRLGEAGHAVGLASAGGELEPQARAAGIALHPLDLAAPPSEAYAAIAEFGAGYDAALLTCDPLLMALLPALLAGSGRVALTILSHAPALPGWFGPAGMAALARTGAALAGAQEGAVIVRGPTQRRLVAELLATDPAELDVVEPGVAGDRIRFDPAAPGDGTVLVLTRLGPDTADRVRGGVELVAAGIAAGRACRLLLVGDGPWREEALALCAAALPAGAWTHEGLTVDPGGCFARADVVVAMGRAAFEAAAHGRRVATSRRTGDGRGVLGPPLTPEHYDEFADDLLGVGYEPWAPADVWRALDGMDTARLAAVRARVLERNSGDRQAADVAALLGRLRPTASGPLLGALGAAAAAELDALRESRRVADELWAARAWYEGQLAQARAAR